MSRCYYCGIELTWDDTKMSPSGKKIPLEGDGSPHRCPFRPVHNISNKQGDGTAPLFVTVERVTKGQDELKAVLLQVLEIVLRLQTKMEMMDGSRKEDSVNDDIDHFFLFNTTKQKEGHT